MQVSKPAARAGVRSIAIAQNVDNAIAVAMIPGMASLQPGGRLTPTEASAKMETPAELSPVAGGFRQKPGCIPVRQPPPDCDFTKAVLYCLGTMKSPGQCLTGAKLKTVAS
jgi:hypothetical protein